MGLTDCSTEKHDLTYSLSTHLFSYVTMMLVSVCGYFGNPWRVSGRGVSAGTSVTAMLPCLCQDAPFEPSCSQHVYFAPSEPCYSAGWVAMVYLPKPSCSTSGLSFEYIGLFMMSLLVTCDPPPPPPKTLPKIHYYYYYYFILFFIFDY